MVLNLHENEMASLVEEAEETIMWFVRAEKEEESSLLSDEPDIAQTSKSETGKPKVEISEPELKTDYTERMDLRYVMTSAEVEGYTITPEQMGGLEYALVFHLDGTCDFVVAGTSIPLTWELGRESDMMNDIAEGVVDENAK
ncbi:MAG: hypothetical protein GX786_04580, partial [Clostridiales bacterium]|nr:hypothetical protein [Clostridiales bacterium]